MPPGDPRSQLPLTAVVLHILLALADGERHGYAIAQEIEATTGGEIRSGPGTLYGSIQRMLTSALIEEAPQRKRMSRKQSPFAYSYRAALLIFPRAFRERYADEMCEFANAKLADAHESPLFT